MENQVVLITGASSGIGKATAEYLKRKGFRVYGTSRKAKFPNNSFFKEQETDGFIRVIPMDVLSDSSVKEAISYVLSIEGHIDVLISNAGTGIAGAIEDVSMDEAKYQFDTNFYGTLRVIKAILPVMRNQGFGKIIALSSVAGVISIPYQAHYSSSKFAIEGLIEALRYEIAPFGLKACIVEPGDTRTEFTYNRVISKNSGEDSPYYNRFRKSLQRMEKDEQNGVPPEKVASVIYKMIKRKKPPVRTTVGFHYKAILFLKRLVPSRFLEFMVGMFYN